jgi:hypothetical protein
MQEVKNTLSLLALMAAAGTTAPHQDAASMVRDPECWYGSPVDLRDARDENLDGRSGLGARRL